MASDDEFDQGYDYQDDSDSDEETSPGITCIKAFPNNREALVYGDGQGNLTVFDARTKVGTAMGLFSRSAESGAIVDLRNGRAHRGGVSAVEVINDGTTVVSGGKDGSVCLWDVRSGARLLSERRHGDSVTAITSLGGAALMTTSLDGAVMTWDLESLEAHRFGHVHRKGVNCATRIETEQPDERIVLTGSRDDPKDGNLACLSAHGGGHEDRVFGYLKAGGHDLGAVTALCAAGPRRALSGGGARDHRVLLWDMDLVFDCGRNATWGARSVFQLGCHRGAVSGLCKITGDAACSAGSDGSLRIWRLESRVLAAIFQGGGTEPLTPPRPPRGSLPASPALSPALSPASPQPRKSVRTGGAGRAGHSGPATSPVGSATAGRGAGGEGFAATAGAAASEGLLAVCATADGSCVASGSTGGTLRVWDVRVEHVRSESFLRREGGEPYRRQLAAVRRSLPGLGDEDRPPSSSGRRKSRLGLSTNVSLSARSRDGGQRGEGTAFPEEEEEEEEQQQQQQQPHQPQPSLTATFDDERVGGGRCRSGVLLFTSVAARRPATPPGTVPWVDTKKVSGDVAARLRRPPDPLPSSLHGGPRYLLSRARPSTASAVGAFGGASGLVRTLALPKGS